MKNLPATLLSLVLLAASLTPAAGRPFRILDLRQTGTNNTLRITWSANPGTDYQLQRLAGDHVPERGPATWVPVASVRATNVSAFAEDTAGPLVQQRFYRVIQLRPSFRIIDIVRVNASNAYRIRWESNPGNTYHLQHPAGNLLVPPSPLDSGLEWVTAATVYATGSVASAVDEVPPHILERFYRVALVTNVSEDALPPTVVFEGAHFSTTSNGLPALVLAYTATDNVGVTDVRVSEGTSPLGPASPVAGRWQLTVPISPGAVQTRFFSASARDVAGNQGQCGPTGLLVADPSLFVPVTTNGLPMENQVLVTVASNRVGDFIFRPGGRPRPGAAVDFFLRFPEGASLAESNGQTVMEFSRVSAGFETNAPLQLATPLERAGGAPRRLVAGPLGYTNLADLFNLADSNGMALVAFNRFPLRWRGGTLDDRGLVGGQFRLELPNLPLPEWSGACAEGMVELSRDRTLRIPFSGEFSLPDGTATGPRLRVGCGSPLWLSLRADGNAALEGPVEICWPSGASVEARLRFDDPQYHIALTGSGLRVQALSNLVDLLPANPGGCVPDGTDTNQLGQAARCLDTFARAYGHFCAAVAASASNAPASDTARPDYLSLAADVLEAWGYSAAAGPVQALPLDAIAALVGQVGHQAAGAPELPEVLTYRNALLRARAAVQAGGLTGSAGARAELEAALDEAEAAALDRARQVGATLSLADMRQAARLLLEAEALRQQIGLPANPAFADALESLFRRTSEHLADSLGVRAGVFIPDANPGINGLNRFAAIELLREVLQAQADAQRLGIELGGVRLEELAAQLGVRLLRTVSAALDRAEAARDFPATLLAFQDYLELTGWAQQGVIPETPALEPLFDPAAFESVADRLLALWAAELDRPYWERTVGRQASDLRAALRVLREVPGTVSWPVPAIARAYDQLEVTLTNATLPLRLSLQTNRVELLELIEAGTLHRELGARFSFPQPVSWENARLPEVVNRLKAVALAARGWGELDQAVRLLLNAADRAGLAGDQNLRRAYLQQAAVLLGASRELARAMMQDARGWLRAADFALPGEVFLEEPSGYALYNRQSGYFHGAARGQLRLPKWSLALTVQNASFDSGGNFDLSAHGSIHFTNGQLAVPSRQPLHLYYGPERGWGLLGAAELALANGMRFDAFVALTDPIYRFMLSARGLEFDLGEALVLHRPALPAGAVDQFGEGARNALADYLRGLNGALDTLITTVTNYPTIDPASLGRPPEFVPPPVTLELATVNAWVADVMLRVQAGLSNASTVSLKPVQEFAQRLNQTAQAAATTLETEEARLHRIIEAQRTRAKVIRALNALPAPEEDRSSPDGDLGDPQPDVSPEEYLALVETLRSGALQDAAEAAAFLTPDLPDNLPQAATVARALYRSVDLLELMNGDLPPLPNLSTNPCEAFLEAHASYRQRATALTLCAARRHAATYGLDPLSGLILNTNLFNGLSETDTEREMRVLNNLSYLVYQHSGEAEPPLDRGVETLLLRQREILNETLQREMREGHDPVVEFMLSTLLLQNEANGQMQQLGPATAENMENLATNIMAAMGDVLHTLTNQDARANWTSQDFRTHCWTWECVRNDASNRVDQRKGVVDRETRERLGLDRENPYNPSSFPDATVPPNSPPWEPEAHPKPSPDFLALLSQFLERARPYALFLPGQLQVQIDLGVDEEIQAWLAQPVGPEFLNGGCRQAEALLAHLLGLMDWIERHRPADFAAVTNLQLCLSNLTFSVNAVAEAQRAWWLVDRYQEALRHHSAMYATNSVAGLSNALRQARSATLAASERISAALTAWFEQVPYEDVVFQLPGRVEIPNLFGRLYYNRLSGFLEGCFGGRLEFSEAGSNVFFEITEACLANNGSYHLLATNALPLSFGNARLAAGLNVTGTAAGVATFLGNGTLTVSNGPPGEQTFSVALAYDQNARRLMCDALAQNLDLRFSDDFVLFDAGFGFDLTAANPAGEFRLRGAAGLFARQHPLPETVQGTHFHLLVTNLSTAFGFREDRYDFVLSNGIVVLPEWFRPGLCPASPPGSGPAVALSAARPLRVHYRTDGSQPPLTFEGQVSFTNLGVSVPGLDGLRGELCRGTLVLVSNNFPVVTNLQGALEVPLPPGGTSRVDLVDGAWSVGGFPQGKVRFSGDLLLVRQGEELDPLELWLRWTHCPGGAALSAAADWNGQGPAFGLEGGLELRLPLSVLSEVNGDHVRALACGSVRGSAAGVKVELDSLTLSGTYHFGGLEGVTLTNAQIVLTNLNSLFDPTDTNLFLAQISGTLLPGEGITASLSTARFTFVRKPNGTLAPDRLQADAQVALKDGLTFGARLDYQAATRTFSFDSQVTNLVLRLADDLVIFDAGLGFTVANDGAAGQLRAGGTAGLFARQQPLPAQPQTTNFHLFIDHVATAITYTPNQATLTFSNGTLHLPEFFGTGFCSNAPPPFTGPQVVLAPATPLQATVNTTGGGSVALSGALDFRNFGFRVPGLTNFAVDVCSARLMFPAGGLPVLDQFNAWLSLPLPDQTVLIGLTNLVWRLDGFPEAATLVLGNALQVFTNAGFTLEFLAGSGFGFTSTNLGGPVQTAFTLFGGLRGTFPADLLCDAESNGSFSFQTSGSFRLATGQAPTLAMDSLRFGGRIKLGGSDGLELLGVDANGIPDPDNPTNRPSIELSGLTNLFQLAPDRPFEVLINGAVGSAEFVYFGLGNTRFVFDGVFPEPQFLPGSVGFREGTQLALLGQQLLPFRITAGSLTFLNPALPWNQLFRPQNLRLTLSGVVDISLAPPDPNSPQKLPRLFGMVDNVGIAFPDGFSGPPDFSVNTFALTLENLTIGDMAGLTGGLAVGNLNRPSELFFAGTAGGGFNGVGIKAIVAARLDGLLGVCLKVNGGPAGIPLDGGALGGILLTGAEGGVSFLNAFSDPCDFKAYLGLNPDGTPAGSGAPAPAAASGSETHPVDADAPPAERTPMVSHLPVLTWPQLAYLQALHEQTRALRAGQGAQTALTGMAPEGSGPVAYADPPPTNAPPCPTGDCPPATLNLLCQRHPSVGEAPSPENYQGLYRERVIFKFSSLDHRTVDSLLAAANINLQGSSSVVASNFAGAMTNWVGGLIPRPPATLPPDQAQQINQFIGASLAALRDLVAASVQAALEAAAGQGRTPLEALYEAAYAGVKCVDVTIQLKGTFSYAPVSVALSATGGAVASTAGSAGILGSANLFGIPVGTGEFFYSLTDTNGALNPSLCGGMRVALGPLSLGQLGLAAGCDECLSGELQALQDFAAGLAQDLSPDALSLFRSFLQSAAGARVPDVTNRPINTLFGPPGSGAVLTPEEQIAVLTALINLPRVVQFLEANPGALDEAARNAVRALGERTFQLVLAIYQAVNPRLSLCGEAEPKLFGFSLTGGATLGGVRLFGEKTRLAADVMFSPSFIMANLPFWLMSGGVPVVTVAPPLDEATMGFALGLPMVNEPMLRLMTTNPAAYGLAQLNHLLDSATLTFGYELIPFGLKLADAEGRVILPTLANHPDNPNGYWHGSFAPPTNPDRVTVLKAALDANRLALATWDGKSNNLAAILPSYPVLATRELGRDYFPYGGFLGAGKLLFPKPLYDAPPMADLMALFAPIDDPGQLPDRLSLAGRLFTDYLLGTTNIGQLVTYIPAPRPPPAFWQLAEQTPQELMDAITRMDMATLAQNLSLWPAEQFLMQGNARGQVLGLPLGDAAVLADPAQGLLRLSAATAQGWLTNFISAGVTGEVRSAEYILRSTNLPPGTTAQDLKPEVLLSNAWYLLNLAMDPGATEAQQRAALSNAIARITDTLPKASLVAAGSFRVPPELTNVLTATGAGSIYAFSPRFGPGYGGVGPVADARRNGGVALMAQLNFANYVNIPNAQLGVAVRPVGLPVLSGQFDVNRLAIPGLALENAHFAFNSDPPVNNPYLAASGTVQPIAFTNPVNGQVLLTLRNLTNAGAPIAAGFDLRRAASGPPLPGFAIGPARMDMPMLGPGVLVRIHGASTNDPFAFSSTGPWTGMVSISGQLALRDLVGNEVARLGAAAGQQFSAELAGTGLQMDHLAITLPNDLELIVFPGTAYACTNRVGVGTSLVISRDGNFALQSQLGATLELRDLGFGSISANAEFLLTPTNFVVGINNNLSGGALTNFPSASMSGSLTITRYGVSLNGTATVSAFLMGNVFWVSGAGGGSLQAQLDNTGLRLLSGARLRIINAPGYWQGADVLTLGEFFISGNGDFSVTVTNGNLNLPNFFSVTQGVFTLSRTGGNARLHIQSPTLTLLPGQYFQTQVTGVFDVLDISSTGRFYAKKSVNNVSLPGAFQARGQLEVGYEPDSRQPGLGVNTSALAFGSVNCGGSSNRVLNVTNTGVGTLFVSWSSSRPDVFAAMPFTLNLEPGQVGAVSVRFTPTAAGSTSATLTLTHNAGSARTIALSGTGLNVPMLRLSTTNLPCGDAPAGSSLTRLLRVDNPGAVSLVLTCAFYQAGPFTVSTNRLTVPAGSNALLTVTFSPASTAAFANRLDFTANDQAAVRSVALSGRGYENRWYPQSEGAGTLRAAAFHHSGLGLAVGDAGLIRITRNQGHSWYDKPAWPPLEIGNLYAAAVASNGTSAVVAGDGGAIVDVDITFGKVFNWQQYYKGLYAGYTFSGACFLPDTNRYVLVGYNSSGNNLVFVKGNSFVWSEVALGKKLNAVSMAKVGASTIGLIGTDGGRLLRSTDQGATWSAAFSSPAIGNITGVALAPTGWALFVTDSGRIYQSSTSGSSWSQVTTGRGHLRAVTLAGNTVAYAVSAEGQILASTNSGSGFNTWGLEESGLGALYGAGATMNRAWCVSDNGRIYHRPPYTLNRGVLNYSPNHLDFGLVVAGASKSHVLNLYNRGLAPLQVNNLRPLQSSNYLSFSPAPPFSLAARQGTAVNVLFHPPGNELIYSLGDLLIETTDPDGTQTNELRGWTRTNGWVLKPFLPSATGQTARDVQMVSDTIAYAVTPANIYRTSNGGATWTLTPKPPVSGYYALHFVSTTTGFVCGGTISKGPTPELSYIYRTTDSGSTWSARYLVSNRWPICNIHFPDATTGYALTGYESRSLPPDYPGILLRSSDGGLTWSEISNPYGSKFNGRALHAKSATRLFVSHNDILYQSLNAGGSWGDLFINGGKSLRHVFFYNNTDGHAIGAQGTVWQASNGGGLPSYWSQQASFVTHDLNDGCLVGGLDGWITLAETAPVAAIYRKNKGSWVEQLVESPLAGPAHLKPTVISGRSTTLAVALGTDGCVRRLESFVNQPLGVAVVPALVDLGSAPVGTPLSKTFVLRNVGDRTLTVSNILVDGVAGFNNGFRATTPTPFSVVIGGTYTVTVVASNQVAGTHNAEMQLLTDGAAPTVAMGVRSAALAPPEVVVFQTDPPGLPLRIDGALQTAPVGYTICVGAAAPYEWELGSVHTVEALGGTNVNGQEMLFAGWLPYADRVWTYTAELSSKTCTAGYVVGAPAAPGPPPPGGTATNGLPYGPFLRLSNASISNAVLGNFSVSGSVLLCATNIEAALATPAVRLPANLNVAPVAEISDGSWRFQFASNQLLLNARWFSLTLLGNAVTPPTSLNLWFDNTGHFRSDFSLSRGWPVAPGLLEFGPGSLTLAHTNFFSLASAGEIRLLRKPNSSDWAFKTNWNLTFRDGPFTNSLMLPNSVLRLAVPVAGTEFLEVRGGSNSRFELWRDNNNAFSARLDNVTLEVMNQAVSTTSLAVSTAGLVTWSSSPPGSPFELGPFRWTPSGSSTLYWNIKNGSLSFILAGGTVTAPTVTGWPNPQFPSVSFDSKGDFEKTISLATFRSMSLGSGGYATFKRSGGILSMRVRGQQSFFGSSMQEGFDINSAGSVTGFFSGSFSVDFGAPLGRIDFANVYLSYDAAQPSYQFQGQVRVALADFRIQAGSAGGQVCHLLCDGSSCTPTLCLSSP